MDEILTRVLLGSPSFGHMMRAVSDGVDSSPPIYWSAMWVWTRGLGLSELNLRLFSALTTGAAFLGAWTVCRRLAGFWPATLAATACFALNPQVFLHCAECRNYSLLIALTALALAGLGRLGRSAPTTPAEFLAYSSTVALLVMTHLFGFLITGVLLLALVLSDAASGRFRPKLYLATPVGWLAFLPWIPAFIQQSRIGEPRFWIPRPPASVLWDPASFLFGVPLAVVASGILIGAAAFAINRKGRRAEARELSAFLGEPALVAGPLLVLLVPLLTWVISVSVKPIWLDRYQLPALLGWVVILSWLLGYSFRALRERFHSVLGRHSVPLRLCGVCGAMGVTLCFVHFYGMAGDLPEDRKLVGTRPRLDRPVATQFGHYFLYTTFYQPRVDAYFVLDWPSALANPDPGYVTDFNIMSALKRNFQEFKVVQAAEFAARTDRFYYWDNGGSSWLKSLAASDPGYRETRLGADSFSVEHLR
jgi:hypothetical protein